MLKRGMLAAGVLACLLAAPTPTAAQEPRSECRIAQQLIQQLTPRDRESLVLVPTGWTLPPYPWTAGYRPYPYPYVPTGWHLVSRPTVPAGELAQALEQLSAYACAPAGDPQLARQYAELVTLLGYLQGDVAGAIERPTREILAVTDSPRVRELAGVILDAVTTLRRGGGP